MGFEKSGLIGPAFCKSCVDMIRTNPQHGRGLGAYRGNDLSS